MWVLAILPFILQGVAIGIDEIYFHLRRGLPKWERIGHPIDTLSVIFCIGFVIWTPFSPKALVFYSVAAIFSSLLVTKDEFIHKHYCPASENWLHAVLFILHPITLTLAALIWPVSQKLEVAPWIAYWLKAPFELTFFLYGQFLLLSLFFIYQVVFWNIIWKKRAILKQ